VPLEQNFELRQGQTLRIAGTGQTVTFESVAEDSRCPADVVCVWAGNARVRLRVGEAGRDTTVAVNTSIEPRAIQVGKVKLELKDVTPVPHAGSKTPADSYRVTLRATGA
jgi:hypothetical protein